MSGGLRRIQYRDLDTGTVRTGPTGHGESLTDIEAHLGPLDRTRGRVLSRWGVAEGLAVRAVAGQSGLVVQPGVALDAEGRLIVLAPEGLAVAEEIDPGQLIGVPTLVVPETGVALPTPPGGGDLLVTISWREVQNDGAANSPELVHAPWLRLQPVAGFADDGHRVVLAAARLAADGTVTALEVGSRRTTGIPAGRIELRASERDPEAAGGLRVGDRAAAELAVSAGGTVSLTQHPTGRPSRVALAIDGATGALALTGALSVQGATALDSDLAVQGGATVDGDLTAQGSITTQSAITVQGAAAVGSGLSVQGGVSIPTGALRVGGETPAQQTVHVEGSEVHSGGGGGGFSFSDRATGAFVDMPDAGQRWVWYALNGAAHLWSNGDRISVRATGEGGGLDVGRRMRVRQGGDGSAGIWFYQNGRMIHDRQRILFIGRGDRGFVGMQDDNHIGFWGNDGAGWSLAMNIRSGNVVVGGSLTVNGPIFKNGGGFRIDHPLAPQERYLAHSFVESPDMATLYAGTATTDGTGRAEVVLPDYFEALNADARVQLTTVGSVSAVTVEGPVADGRFTIRTAQPEVTVHWLVTGVRIDEWAQANRIVVESDKQAEPDRYLMPTAGPVTEAGGHDPDHDEIQDRSPR